jgi:hypothetical protein
MEIFFLWSQCPLREKRLVPEDSTTWPGLVAVNAKRRAGWSTPVRGPTHTAKRATRRAEFPFRPSPSGQGAAAGVFGHGYPIGARCQGACLVQLFSDQLF